MWMKYAFLIAIVEFDMAIQIPVRPRLDYRFRGNDTVLLRYLLGLCSLELLYQV